MTDRLSGLGTKAIAILVLLAALWIIGVFAVGFIGGLVKLLLVLAAIVAVFWAVNRL